MIYTPEDCFSCSFCPLNFEDSMIYQISNFLDQHIVDEITKKYENSRGQPVFEINNMGRWGDGLGHGSFAPVFVLKLDEYQDYFHQKYQAVDPVFADYTDLVCFLHIWTPGSQINFHHDGDISDGVDRLSSTIYITPTWNWNWGGLFIYDDPDRGQGWVYPHYNHMVWFRPPVWHSTSMITLAAEHPRLSIQLFFTK